MYQYHDIYDHQYEELVVFLCRKLLGMATQEFATGPDGGRDARFVGVANEIPSTAAPWSGTIVVQAKHTTYINAKYSDKKFCSDADSSVLTHEIQRIKNLYDSGSLNYYILFANRKLPANINEAILDRIHTETGLAKENVLLIGSEMMDKYLKIYPDVAQLAKINPFEAPINLMPDEMANLITSFSSSSLDVINDIDIQKEIKRVSLEQKNEINGGMNDHFLKVFKRYIKYFDPIKQFLAMPENSKYLDLYKNVTEEFDMQIASHKKEEQDIGMVLNRFYELLLNRDVDLMSNKRETRTLLFYMYWNCDIGLEVGN